MEGRTEVGFPRGDTLSLKEQIARTVLRNVRSQGHTYVELRQANRKCIFFCTLCLAPCYSDSVLFDHLRGNLHNERLAAAKITLLGPNPWPFNDGVLFFDNSNEGDKQLENKKDNPRLLEFHDNGNNLAIIKYGNTNQLVSFGDNGLDIVDPSSDREDCNLLIPNVLIKTEMSDLQVRFVGVGKIAARYLEKDDKLDSVVRIWCEWLGKGIPDDNLGQIPQHDFALIILGYSYDLGRKGFLDDVKSLLSTSAAPDTEDGSNGGMKRKKCFSDPEDMSESLSNQYDSSGDDSAASYLSTSKIMLDRYDDQLLHTRVISSKTVRRELRRQQRIAAERMCAICQQKMLPAKDVATLVNMKTGRLVCSSRNLNGAFHVYHTSCLIHWILLCEVEMARNQLMTPKLKGKTKRKTGAKSSKLKKDVDKIVTEKQLDSVFCPECQGTGVDVEGDSLEKPIVPLSEMFKLKIKASDAHRAWMKNPEVLENCSVGFHFPTNSEEKEKVLPLKLLHFYGAVDNGCLSGSPSK